MIYLDTTTIKLQAVLASAANTNQPVAHVWFFDVPASEKTGFEDYRGSLQRTALNDTTDVDICAAPLGVSVTRCIISISVNNRSADTETVTIKTDDGTTERIIVSVSLATGETLWYERGSGWGIT